MLIGSDQVLPSSVLFTKTNWLVSMGCIPGLDAYQFRSPRMSMRPNSCYPNGIRCCDLPKWKDRLFHSQLLLCLPSLPISMIIFMGSQLCPPSVDRLMPTSMSPCKSTELFLRVSYTAMRVPVFVVTRPGILYV